MPAARAPQPHLLSVLTQRLVGSCPRCAQDQAGGCAPSSRERSQIELVMTGGKVRGVYTNGTPSDQILVTFKEVGRTPLLLEMRQSLPWNVKFWA